jgi:hypothetical protein
MGKKKEEKVEEEKTEALAVKEEQALTTEPVVEGLDDCDPGDLIVPRYSIVQPSADKLKTAGGNRC